jgi:hypothetical protein
MNMGKYAFCNDGVGLVHSFRYLLGFVQLHQGWAVDGNERGLSNGVDEEGERQERKKKEFCIGISEAPFSFYPPILLPPFQYVSLASEISEGVVPKDRGLRT